MNPQNTAKFLFWLGVVVMVVEFVANLMNLIHLSAIHAVALSLNLGNTIVVLFGSFFQGGVLMGLGKILEVIQSQRNG